MEMMVFQVIRKQNSLVLAYQDFSGGVIYVYMYILKEWSSVKYTLGMDFPNVRS